MNRKKIGFGTKRVLIIHGWMHSSERYVKLAKELESDCSCTILDLPGFGGSNSIAKWNIIEAYTNEMITLLSKEKFDILIGHSLGGAIILRVLEKMSDKYLGDVILASPSYCGINHLKPIAFFVPINAFLFKIQSMCPRIVSAPFIKVVGLLSVNKWDLIDDVLINDSRKANAWTAAVLMYELAFDKWRTKNLANIEKIRIINSKKDRIILDEKISVLKTDLKTFQLIEIPDVGHTTVLEAYDEFVKIIRDTLGR